MHFSIPDTQEFIENTGSVYVVNKILFITTNFKFHIFQSNKNCDTNIIIVLKMIYFGFFVFLGI